MLAWCPAASAYTPAFLQVYKCLMDLPPTAPLMPPHSVRSPLVPSQHFNQTFDARRWVPGICGGAAVLCLLLALGSRTGPADLRTSLRVVSHVDTLIAKPNGYATFRAAGPKLNGLHFMKHQSPPLLLKQRLAAAPTTDQWVRNAMLSGGSSLWKASPLQSVAAALCGLAGLACMAAARLRHRR